MSSRTARPDYYGGLWDAVVNLLRKLSYILVTIWFSVSSFSNRHIRDGICNPLNWRRPVHGPDIIAYLRSFSNDWIFSIMPISWQDKSSLLLWWLNGYSLSSSARIPISSSTRIPISHERHWLTWHLNKDLSETCLSCFSKRQHLTCTTLFPSWT